MLTKSKSEMKFWNMSNNKCLGTYKENCGIKILIVTKNNTIVTSTTDGKVNILKI